MLKIPLGKPVLDDEMIDAAIDSLRNERFVMGESVYKFEEEFAKYFGARYAISTNSGTAALHLSLIALGIRRGDQVVTTPFSFIATSNSVLHAGGTPIFADIDVKTYNIDPDQIRRTITRRTKVIAPVHLYGYPADMDRIMEVAEERGIRVLEDACQAHGAEYKGSKVGTHGDVSCFSFYPSKNMTVCGDGGMVLTNNEEIAGIVRKLRDCGRKGKYVHDVIGYTMRLNTINAAIGRVQLQRLDGWNEKRRENASLYDNLLSDIEEIALPPAGNPCVKPVYHLYVVRAKRRDKLKKWLEDNNIECGVNYPLPIHLQPIYQELFGFKGGEYPNSELVSQTCLSIPMHPDLSTDEIRYVSKKIHEFYGKTLKSRKVG
jgi:perosamine synthetase